MCFEVKKPKLAYKKNILVNFIVSFSWNKSTVLCSVQDIYVTHFHILFQIQKFLRIQAVFIRFTMKKSIGFSIEMGLVKYHA